MVIGAHYQIGKTPRQLNEFDGTKKNYEAVPEYLSKEHIRVQNALYKIIVTMYSVIFERTLPSNGSPGGNIYN